MGIEEILKRIGSHDPITDVLRLDAALPVYIIHRLAEREPMVPLLSHKLEENPRDFIDSLLCYCRKSNPKKYQEIKLSLTTIVGLFYPEQKYENTTQQEEEMKLLSNALFLCITFNIEEARKAIWNLHKSRAYEGQHSNLGSVRVLITEAVGIIGGKDNTVRYWRKYFKNNQGKDDHLTAFSNLYKLDAIGALPEAKTVIDMWQEENLPTNIDGDRVISRYLLTLVKSDSKQDAINTVHTLAQYLDQKLDNIKLAAMNREIKKYHELNVFFPDLYSKK